MLRCACAGVLLLVLVCAARDEARVVRIAQGSVRGYRHPTGDFYAFYGIPYATAPTGSLKFKVDGNEAGNALVTPLVLRVSMGGGDHLLSSGPCVRLPFISPIKVRWTRATSALAGHWRGACAGEAEVLNVLCGSTSEIPVHETSHRSSNNIDRASVVLGEKKAIAPTACPSQCISAYSI
ncbi:hypothetical protein EVAR_25552_1 [Eumeta japonica]|uniref:Carboxylesterase type B domain-containing protein n=1 Tax=Eumeta variegata TaxID=151549 RepID=A0A4C1Z7P2_EUMVA|nr:hypothetical protein EVAR_25552_1 [Eumeta japonica]